MLDIEIALLGIEDLILFLEARKHSLARSRIKDSMLLLFEVIIIVSSLLRPLFPNMYFQISRNTGAVFQRVSQVLGASFGLLSGLAWDKITNAQDVEIKV